jgi:hypothetical protein
MERSISRGRLVDLVWLLAWGIASSAWCVTAADRLGATFDEPEELTRGLDWWRIGSHGRLMRVGTMPLPMDLATLPLAIWERWYGTQLNLMGDDLAWALPWARATTLVFWWLLLVYGWLAGRRLAGPWGGRLAVALLACEPSLLAHASLATKDIAITACLLALMYHFVSGRQAGWPRRVGLPMVWFATAILAKASGLPFGILCLTAVEIQRLVGSGTLAAHHQDGRGRLRVWWDALKPFRRDLLQITAGGLVLVFIYCGSDCRCEPTFISWAQSLPDGSIHRGMLWVAEHLAIFSNAGEGLVKQISHNLRGHGAYLLGDADPRAFWYYFPVALSMKLSIPLLVGAILLVMLRPHALWNWACVAAGVLLLFSLNCRVQIGIRLMLPLVGLMVVGLAAAIVRMGCSWQRGWRRFALAAGVSAAVCWTCADAVACWPHGLCYVNPLWGGSEHGYRCLSDSNYDWGQGLKELALWTEKHGLKSVDVWYFGADPAIHSPGFRYLPLHCLPIHRPIDVLDHVHGHHLAVSTTLLYGAYGTTTRPDKEPKDAMNATICFLRSRQPVDRTMTFFIYDFTSDTLTTDDTDGTDKEKRETAKNETTKQRM